MSLFLVLIKKEIIFSGQMVEAPGDILANFRIFLLFEELDGHKMGGSQIH
jgi:hypothetical protein